MFRTTFGVPLSSSPRSALRAAGRSRRLAGFARLALAASAVLTAPLAHCEDVLLDLPAPRPVPVKPVTDAPAAPEPVAPPPATAVAPGDAPATLAPDEEMLTDDEAAAPTDRTNRQGTKPDAPRKADGKANATKTTSDTAKSDKTRKDATGDTKDEKRKKETNDCCGRPGMIPVCRCVPITKKKSHTEYDTKCELVCVPGCGLLHGRCLGGHGSGHSPGCCDDGCPSCADVRIRQRKTLQKRVTEKEYDTYEFKIEWVPASCAFGGCTECARGGHGRHGLLDWILSHD